MANINLRHVLSATALAASMAFAGAAYADAAKDPDQAKTAVTPNKEAAALVTKATKTVSAFASSKVSSKFHSALENGRAVLIVPQYERAGIGLGGEGGKGVLLKRIPGTPSWTYPAFYSMGGATLGPQLGYEKGSLMVVIHNQQTLDELMNGELTVGAEARAVVGSKGVQAQTTTTAGHKIDVFIRSEGAFAGAILKGGDIKPVGKLNVAYYGRKTEPKKILTATGPMNPHADGLRSALTRLARKSVTAPSN